MTGRKVEQAVLFHEFRLEERVPADHRLRRVDAVLDLSSVREHGAGHHSTLGRPSACPDLMIRMARSSATCSASGRNVAYAKKWT